MQFWTAATPNGWKVAIMLEELKEAGVALPPIEVRTVDLSKGEQFSDAFRAVNPNEKIPALVDGDTRLMESCAILTYLGETYPSDLLPTGAGKWQTLQWVFWQAANLGPVFGNKLSYTRYLTDIDDAQRAHPLERFGTEAQRLLRVFAEQLGETPYLMGEHMTIADIAAYPWLRGWKWSKIDITGHANIMAWIDRMRARPGVERGLAYGAPDGETDQWSEATKQRYAKMGSGIADNKNLLGKD